MQKCVLGKAEKTTALHAKSYTKMPFAYKKHPLKPSLKGCPITLKIFAFYALLALHSFASS